MEPQVNYDQRYSGLLTVYRLRSFAAAAVELSLTASAVSKQIRSLESDLGRPLFIRSGSRLIPTRACEAIVPFAEKIDALCVRMQQELASTDRSVRRLVVAVSNENPLSEKSFVRLSELRHERLILCAPGSGTRNLFEAHLKSAGMQIGQFNVMMELDSISTIKKLVGDNYGVSVLPNKVCARDAEAGRFRIKPIADMNMARQIHMFYWPELRCEELLGDIQRLYYEVMSN